MIAPKYQFEARAILEKGLVREECFHQMRLWLHTTNYPHMCDEQIVLFLASCNNCLESTQKAIRVHFESKRHAPEIFYNRSMDALDIRKAINCTEMSVIPVRTKDNYSVIFARLNDTKYYNFHVECIIKLFFICLELPLYKFTNGIVVVIDLQGIGLMHLTRFRLGPVQKFFHYLQEGLPCQLRAIHILNVVYFFDKIMALLKPFMKKKLVNLINTHHSDMNLEEFFQQCVPKECMPGDYGGSLPNQKQLSADTYSSIRSMREFYRDEEEQSKLYKHK